MEKIARPPLNPLRKEENIFYEDKITTTFIILICSLRGRNRSFFFELFNPCGRGRYLGETLQLQDSILTKEY